MLYHISVYLQQYFSVFNVVHYVSFRVMAALITSIFSAFFFGPLFIKASLRFFRSPYREWAPDRHRLKDNMPTMGGLFILFIVIMNSLLWRNFFIWGLQYLFFFLLLLALGLVMFYTQQRSANFQRHQTQ